MSGDFNQEQEEFEEILEGQGWVFFNGQWLCPDCAEDAGDFMKGEN
jgi:rubredoxin